MIIEKLWSHFFKPEARSSGEDLSSALKVGYKSETQFEAYIKTFKVLLSTPSVGSSEINSKCSCPAFSKGTLCKHIWAALLAVEKNLPQFLENKTSLEKLTTESRSQATINLNKEKQSAFRKKQYKVFKERAKAKRQSAKTFQRQPLFSEAVQGALDYFSQNGFPLNHPIDEELLKNAKKKLARVFHPDVGGTHEETVVLNKTFDVLMDYLKN